MDELNEYCKTMYPDMRMKVEYSSNPLELRAFMCITILKEDGTDKYGGRFYPLPGESLKGIIDCYVRWARGYEGLPHK